jgi:hypothetical protein
VPADLSAAVGDGDEAERHLDAVNRALLDRLQRDGEVFVSNAVVNGRFLLRACIVNFHTTLADVEATVATVARVGREVDDALRPNSTRDPYPAPASGSTRPAAT